MVSTTSPLTKAETRQLMAALPTWLDEKPHNEAVDATRQVRFILATGAHPIVLSRPQECELQRDGEYLVWRRPKTKRRMRLPISPGIRPWVDAFLNQIRMARLDVKSVNRAVQQVGIHAGLKGMSPRTLRHTFIRLLADRTRDLDDVRRWGGVTLNVAWQYLATTDSERDHQLADRDLTDGL